MLKSGVVIVAAGHPYYGRMAFNLAKTIKAVDPACRVQIIKNGNALNHLRSPTDYNVFDDITTVPDIQGFELKLHADYLSVYDQFLLLDADCIWVSKKSPVDLMNELSNVCDFTGITEGVYNIKNPHNSDVHKHYYFWADVKDIIDTYQLSESIYQWRTEFMFIKKSETAYDLFSLARLVYNEATNKLHSIKLFAGHVPDELAINIATSIKDIHPHVYKWCPSFWHRLSYENIPSMDAIANNYYILSCGSNVNTSNVKRVYNMFVKAASYKLGMQHVFELISKREMMPERQKM